LHEETTWIPLVYMYIKADVISRWEQKLHESCTDVVFALISIILLPWLICFMISLIQILQVFLPFYPLIPYLLNYHVPLIKRSKPILTPCSVIRILNGGSKLKISLHMAHHWPDPLLIHCSTRAVDIQNRHAKLRMGTTSDQSNNLIQD
jgi:hypothetical protein